MFGISSGEFVVLLAVAAVVVGPERLPEYAAQLARLVKQLRRMAQGATEQVRTELGPDFDDVDWRKLDPRQYDPRRIVREALADSIDLDDPLGLKEKPVPPGGPYPSVPSPGVSMSKPAFTTSTDVGAGAGAGAGSGGRAALDVPFDPDAT